MVISEFICRKTLQIVKMANRINHSKARMDQGKRVFTKNGMVIA
jgi:hypothetical protein